LKTIEGRSQVLRSYIKLALKLFIICSIFICSAGKLYAEEQSGSFFEETLMTESFAEAAEVENFDEEAESGGLAAHDTGVANADPEKIPDSTLDTTPDIDSLTEESFITEDAESAEISEEDSTEQSDEIFADPIEDSYIDDINDTGNEELSGASGYVLNIIWLDGGSRQFSLSDCGSLTEARKQAGSLLQKLGLSDRCTIEVKGNVIYSKVKNPAHISSNIRAIAHMGFCKNIPENTLSSIRMAAAVGFSEVEFDVRFTKDGIPVLLHEEIINNYGRTADGNLIQKTINIKNLTYKELQMYDFGVQRGQMWKGEKAPTLDSALKICAKSGLRPNLDIKSDGRMTEQMLCGIYSLIKKYNLQGRVVYVSNVMRYLNVFAQKDPDSDYTYFVPDPKEGYIDEAEGLRKRIHGKLFIFLHEWKITEAVERTCRFHSIPISTTVVGADRIASLDKWVKAINVYYILPEKVINEASKRQKNSVISYDGDVRIDRNYRIYASRNCGFSAHIKNGTAGSRVVMWDGSGRGELNDFRFEPVSENMYRIISTDCMLALSTDAASSEIVLRLPSDEPEQMWLIQQNPNRTYTFINAFDGRSLHANIGITQGDVLIAAEKDQSSTEEFFLSLSSTEMPGGKVGDTRKYWDVRDSAHPYYTAVYWASWRGITKGFPDGSFGLNTPCTRGQALMFLWRYAGKPAPKAVSKSPFKDVAKTHVFYNAILWASQKGITKGYSDGTFGVDRNVSRGEFMMFLWRLKGKPAPKAVSVSTFRDVPKRHVFYNAILWGAQKRITTGYTSGEKKGTFGIDENCTRGQIVTFLYRLK
jgi:glycerophosphoryl diester phosphodiesterase